jgi:hydrogenase maturation protease
LRSVLVIGYGNELRRDDALGPKVASAVEARNLPGVRVITCHQLTLELAEPMSQVETVIFIDAAVSLAAVQVTPLSPRLLPQVRAHSSDPASLLSLAHSLFGRAPQAWSIALPAFDMDFGEGLSSRAEDSMRAGLEAFERLIASW